jgi:hypothetical protein
MSLPGRWRSPITAMREPSRRLHLPGDGEFRILCLLLAFGLPGAGGDYAFAAICDRAPEQATAAILFLVLIGSLESGAFSASCVLLAHLAAPTRLGAARRHDHDRIYGFSVCSIRRLAGLRRCLPPLIPGGHGGTCARA